MKINGRYYVLQVNGEKNRIMSNEDRKYENTLFQFQLNFLAAQDYDFSERILILISITTRILGIAAFS